MDKTDDSSDFASSNSDKSDRDALKHCISNPDGVNLHDYISNDDNTAVFEVPTDRNVFAARCGHAIMDDRDDETKSVLVKQKLNAKLSK